MEQDPLSWGATPETALRPLLHRPNEIGFADCNLRHSGTEIVSASPVWVAAAEVIIWGIAWLARDRAEGCRAGQHESQCYGF